MAITLSDLIGSLDLARDGTDRSVGRSPATGGARIFGGLVVAQSLVAMARTAPGRPIHALHGHFLLPGDPREPIVYAVERLRDGASFTVRRCMARQQGRTIFASSGSFHAAEDGALDHSAERPDAPAPEALPTPDDVRAGRVPEVPRSLVAELGGDAAVELRPADPSRFALRPPGPHPARQAVWMRAAGPLPDDPALHAAVLAYMSDKTLLDTALVPHGRSVFDADVQAASLDHALWFHRPPRADDWMLYAEDSPSAAGGRGFARGAVFDRSGALVASSAQEGLIRRRAPR